MRLTYSQIIAIVSLSFFVVSQIATAFDSNTPNTNAFRRMRLHYLDNPDEKATIAILRQLGISDAGSVSGTAFKLPQNLEEEHKSSSSVTYKIISGELSIEIRDSANCWIRAVLQKDDTITLPANLYRRFAAVTNEVTLQSSSTNIEVIKRYTEEPDSVALNTYHNCRELVCELCRQFFTAGWVTGTGGSISIRHGNRIYMTPSGVQKERILPDELYVVDINGDVVHAPERKPGSKGPKLSDCAPLFLHAFKQRNAGAVLHSHSIVCNLAMALFEGQPEFRISHQEMIKGIAGYGYFDQLVIPIIENTAWEHELADSLGETIAAYPKACAVLVRRHGMYVWGDTWEQAKRHGECLHYLFEIALGMHKLGLDFNSPAAPLGTEGVAAAYQLTSHSASTSTATSTVAVANGAGNGNRKRPLDGSSSSTNCATDAVVAKKSHAIPGTVQAASSTLSKYKYVVFDVEGTTTPITFVKDVLFPYAADHVAEYLQVTWDTPQTKADVEELKRQSAADAQDSSLGAPALALSSKSDKKSSIEALAAYVQWNIAKDRKIGALKQLQGHIWEKGYSTGAITSVVYDDVPRLFARLKDAGVQVAIYSSGSRDAQRLLFKHSDNGDLRPHIACYFDTKVGQKREAASYAEIALSLGVDTPSQILFVTDIIEEARAAKEAGLNTVLSVRPGNAPLPEKHEFAEVTSFDALL